MIPVVANNVTFPFVRASDGDTLMLSFKESNSAVINGFMAARFDFITMSNGAIGTAARAFASFTIVNGSPFLFIRSVDGTPATVTLPTGHVGTVPDACGAGPTVNIT